VAEIKGKKVAFFPRHGKKHTMPPHMINFRANLWAMKELGVKKIISPFACGSLKHEIKLGEFVIVDQFFDRTRGRKDTFFDGPTAVHISCDDLYCPDLRKIAAESIKKVGVKFHQGGTVVIIQGPRFSTKAESRWFSQMGWDVVTMTQYPENVLARELEMCIVGIALVTDYDVGLVGDGDQPVSAELVGKTFQQNIHNIKKVVFDMIDNISPGHCRCQESLKFARLS
jgi:5'-methylthioadenosine phosphorylase